MLLLAQRYIVKVVARGGEVGLHASRETATALPVLTALAACGSGNAPRRHLRAALLQDEAARLVFRHFAEGQRRE
ncbi:MAG: hypothetical protein IPI73_30740 [Betaproteobacteria bacterium]|nr:hypothetical protein [Betaproteobacteria bacterium]